MQLHEAKGRVENASKYLMEQLESFNQVKKLPYTEASRFTADFMVKNK